MKRLSILLIAVMITACSRDYKSEFDPKKIDGVELKIDSAKWTPALIQIEGSEITIYESKEIRKVNLIDSVDTFMIGFLLGLFACLVAVASAKS
jgi:uncharacterized membrane protein